MFTTYNFIYKPFKHTFQSFLCFCLVFVFTCCSSNKNDQLDLANLGNKYYIEHNYEKALKLYEEAIKNNYRSFDVFYNLGSIYYYEKKDFKKAEEIFKKALLVHPNDDILHFTLSQLYFDMDNLSEGVKEYKLAVKLCQDRPLTINANKTKELLSREGKNEKEIYNFFMEIINYNPNDFFALQEAADYEKKEGAYEKALKKYQKVVELYPRMKNVLLMDMGTCFYKIGDYKSALLYFGEAKNIGNPIPDELLDEIKSKK
jgi:tetratricopeptide (TPR) repeat protein